MSLHILFVLTFATLGPSSTALPQEHSEEVVGQADDAEIRVSNQGDLASYSPEELTLTGTITGDNPVALFETPDGLSIVGRPGDRVGPDASGTISSIEVGRVEFTYPPTSADSPKPDRIVVLEVGVDYPFRVERHGDGLLEVTEPEAE